MSQRPSTRWRATVTALVAAGVFGFSWLFRFNDPNGSFAGLSDDHFFYLIRGWQILFGDLPVRDFVDHGAPLYYYVAAGVQTIFGRGTLSELQFSVTIISIGAALTFWLAARASGSIVFGLVGAAFQILLAPRFYNYPKILVYAAAIPLLWWFADRPGTRSVAWIAVVTVVGFLFRHDHGAFVAVAMLSLLTMLTSVPWRSRVRLSAIYAALVLGMISPYLVYLQVNGGIVPYFAQAAAWAERDRIREPVVWPGLFDESPETRPVGVSNAASVVGENSIAWTYYTELLLPFFALCLLAVSTDGARPSWPNARAKIAMVAVLALALDVGFLRSSLEARLADPSVPLAILIAWIGCAVLRLLTSDDSLPRTLQGSGARWPIRVVAVAGGLALALVLGAGVARDLYDRLDSAAMTDRLGKPFERVGVVSSQVRVDWELESWTKREHRPGLIDLALYVNACTAPTDRILVQAYMPPVLALARRAFAGGHADLRPDFFTTDEAQQLTIARLQRQSVPIILLDSDGGYDAFRKSFPLIIAYIDRHYAVAAAHTFDGRFGINLLVRRDTAPKSTWEPLGWPCFGSGQVGS